MKIGGGGVPGRPAGWKEDCVSPQESGVLGSWSSLELGLGFIIFFLSTLVFA